MTHRDATEQELLKLLSLFKETRCKPCGRATGGLLLQNSCRGPVTVTRHSLTFVQRYSTDNPLVQLLLTAVLHHRQQFKDGGCLIGILVCKLVVSFYKSDCHPTLYAKVLGWLSHQSSLILQKIANERLELKIENMARVLRGILHSKLLPHTPLSVLDNLVTHLAQVFILSSGDVSLHTLAYMGGIDTQPSATLHKGVMIDAHHSPIILAPGQYRAALVSCSLLGDTDELLDVTFRGSATPLTEALIGRIEQMVELLATNHVSLFICQKVIHPRIKLMIESHDMRYLERLGLTMARLSHLTGRTPYSSIVDTKMVATSSILNVTHIEHSGDTYLLLQGHDSDCKPTFTLQLCHWTEQISREIEVSCMQALDVLGVHLLIDDRMLPGGGLWQSELSSSVKRLAEGLSAEDVKKFGANMSRLRMVVDDFTAALLFSVGMDRHTDNNRSRESTDVKDCYIAQHKAVTTAVSIATAIIRTGNVIKET